MRWFEKRYNDRGNHSVSMIYDLNNINLSRAINRIFFELRYDNILWNAIEKLERMQFLNRNLY